MIITDIALEGGAIDSNGCGTILTTEECLLESRNKGKSKEDNNLFLKNLIGANNVIWLKKGLLNDHTDGHIDDIARFVGPSTVVCAYEMDIADANYPALHDNYEILRQSSDQSGQPLTVVKLPMPAPVMDGDERYPASYTNFYIGNSVVIVPVFKDPHDAEALKILRKLFPDREVIGINARAMVEGFGTFHCGTQQQPRL